MADWGAINRRLMHHGYQPVMVFPSGQLQESHGGNVIFPIPIYAYAYASVLYTVTTKVNFRL